MTDPIRIPLTPTASRIGLEVEITPELASQIVALAAPPTPATPPAEAPDDAAMVIQTIINANDCFTNDHGEALAVLDAIKAGKVPGIYHYASQLNNVREYTSRYDEMKADLAACRAELDSERDRREKAEREASDCNDLLAEIDADSPDACIREVQYMRRDLERLEDERDKALADLAAERDRLAGLLREAGRLLTAAECADASIEAAWVQRLDVWCKNRNAALAELEKNK